MDISRGHRFFKILFFLNPQKKMTSHAYRITYRHLEKTFRQEEANEIHQKIEEMAANSLGVTIR